LKNGFIFGIFFAKDVMHDDVINSKPKIKKIMVIVYPHAKFEFSFTSGVGARHKDREVNLQM